MLMSKSLFAVLVAVLFILLTVHFLYTIYAVIRGAAFIPTSKNNVKRMIELTNPGPKDTVLDLGSGDGRILFACAKHGAKKCIGIEINSMLVFYSRIKAKLLGYKNVSIQCKDFWNIGLSDVDVLTLFFVPNQMEKLNKKIDDEMKKGSRVVSHRYELPGRELKGSREKVYLYEV